MSLQVDPSIELRRVLNSSEHLLWSGRPKAGLVLRPADAFLIPFSLLWGGFAIFWEVAALSAAIRMEPKEGLAFMPVVFPLFGLPFVLVGLYLILGRFFVDAWRRDRTVYGVTNERVIIVSGLFGRKTTSVSLSTLSNAVLTENKDGTGSIALGPTAPHARMYNTFSWTGPANYGPPCLDLIPDARRVYGIILQAQQGE